LTDVRTTAYSDVPSTSFAWRVAYWDRLLPMVAAQPILGIGPDRARVIDPARFDRPDVFAGRPPHSMWVEALVETGALGLLVLIGVVIAFGVTLRRRWRDATDPFERRLA